MDKLLLTRVSLITFFFLLPIIGFCQEKFTVSGFIKEAESGEDLIGANVYIKELLQGTTTNQYGFFSITVASGQYHLVVSYLGYEDIVQEIDLSKNIRLSLPLKTKSITTSEVVVEAERQDKNVAGTQMGTIKLEIDQIKTLPAFLGEVDILKTIQMLPGVQSAGEGNSGFYVRGGGPDQNLILLDEAVVYNVSHLFGFFSVFNADAIKNMELIKGGMPANYGGRLASVLDISMKEGNAKKFEADGGLGLISSRLTLQGPIKKDVSSFVVSGRRTYLDIILTPMINSSPKLSAFKGTGYHFYDLTTKVNYRFSEKDRVFLSGYFGRDVFKYSQSESGFSVAIPWGNATSSLRWNHLFSDKLFMNTSLIFTDYKFSFEIIQNDFEMILFSGVRDFNSKVDFNYFPNVRHNFKFGASHIYHIFTPNSVSAKQGETVFETGDIIKQYAHEGALYVNDEFDWTDRIKLNLGLRYSIFSHVGPFTRYDKGEAGNTTTEIKYDANELIKSYQGPEPRASIRYQLNSKSSLKAAYTHNNQYIHLASLASTTLPTDIWVGASDKVKPQIGDQFNIGYFKNFLGNMYESSVELYYKTMDNLIEYEDGFIPSDNVQDNPDNHFETGQGDSYGAEFFLKKRTGSYTGWLGYTISKTTRQFDAINNGNPFPARYDRRHDIALVATYNLDKEEPKEISDSLNFGNRITRRVRNWIRSKDWVFGGNFIYATGDANTLPISRYMFEGNVVSLYGERNSFRMAPYHRMDLSVTVKGKERKRYESTWNFSIYNVYSRANPYFIYFDTEIDLDASTIETKAYQVSLFPIMPSITWNFSF